VITKDRNIASINKRTDLERCARRKLALCVPTISKYFETTTKAMIMKWEHIFAENNFSFVIGQIQMLSM
jgi:hypothetical protein